MLITLSSMHFLLINLHQYDLLQGPVFRAFFLSTGEEQEKAAKELSEVLKTIEEKVLGEKKFFGGETINLVDISYGLLAYWLRVVEEVTGVQVMEPKTLPRLCQWAQNFLEVPVIKETIPARDKMLGYIKFIREKIVAGQLYK